MGVGVVVIQVGDVSQHTVVGIQQDLVGVHPEDVRQVAGASSGLQLGPVLIPAGDLDLDGHIGILFMVGISQGLHSIALGGVPDLHGQLAVAAGVTAAAASAGGNGEGHGSSHEDEGGSFQMFHVFSPFNTWNGVEQDRLCAPSQAHRCTGSALPVPRTAVLTKLV